MFLCLFVYNHKPWVHASYSLPVVELMANCLKHCVSRLTPQDKKVKKNKYLTGIRPQQSITYDNSVIFPRAKMINLDNDSAIALGNIMVLQRN